MISVEDARDDVMDNLENGIVCPVCDQFAKQYRRKLNSGMGMALVRLHRLQGDTDDFIHVSKLGSHETAQLSWWRLIQEESGTRDDGGRIGFWRIRPRGRLFLLGDLRVPKYAVVYNSVLLRLEGPLISVYDVLGDNFNLQELMGR